MFKRKTKEGVMENYDDRSVKELLSKYGSIATRVHKLDFTSCQMAINLLNTSDEIAIALVKRIGMAEEYRERAIRAENKLKELKKAVEVIQSIQITD